MGRNGGQRTGPFRLPLWSATQAKKRAGCVRRWGYNRLLGLKEPQGKNAILGTLDHSEMEDWSKFGILPPSKETCAVLKFSPAPRVAEVEVPCRFALGTTEWVGYIDLAYDWQLSGEPQWQGGHGTIAELKVEGKPMPIGSTGVTVIHDWKFSGSLDWAMTAEDLTDDFAANIYAYEAFQGGAQRVFCRWVYSKFGGGATPKVVWQEMFIADVLRVLAELQALAEAGDYDRVLFNEGKLQVLDLPIDTTKCFEYRQECPFKGDCKPEFAPRSALKMRRDMTQAFAEHLNDVGPKKAPPPPPAKKGPPPPPPKKAAVTTILSQEGVTESVSPLVAGFESEFQAAFGKPESGTFNAPGGPSEPAATPEDAKRIQGIKEPVPEEAPEPDELDTMELHQLQALADAIGAQYVPRARTKSLIESIRAKRIENAKVGSTDLQAASDKDQAEAFDKEVAEAAEKSKAMMEKSLDELVDAGIVTPAEAATVKAPPAPPKEVAAAIGPLSGGQLAGELVAQSYTLYINCVPTGDYTTVSRFIANLMAEFTEATGCRDYRQIDFGKGLGIMADGIGDELENGRFPSAIVCDTRTQEGFAFCATFERFASTVVRGF